MLSISKLEKALGDGDWVVASPDGDVLDREIPKSIGPATLMVRPLTDALKRVVADRVVESISRDDVWSVEAFALNRVVVEKLEGELEPRDLYEAVRATGLAWQVYEL